MEKWNRFLNEEVIEELTQVRKHFNIDKAEWRAFDQARRKELIDAWKQDKEKAQGGEQPQAAASTAEPSPAAAEPSPAAGGEESLDVGSGPEKALKVFMRDFLKSPLASLSKELVQQAKHTFTEYEPGEWEDEGGRGTNYDAILAGFLSNGPDGILGALNAHARAHYQDGDASAGAKYMEIREFIEEKLNPVLAHYDLPRVPVINLWIDDLDPSQHRAGFQATAEKYANGTVAAGKVIGLNWSGSGIKVYSSIGSS
tara:strand:+ start:1131 stop:1898 length:768 start_codon:yes stop_codon:yes gene_type:complete